MSSPTRRVLLATLLALVGCGGGEPETTTEPTAPADQRTDAPTPTPEPEPEPLDEESAAREMRRLLRTEAPEGSPLRATFTEEAQAIEEDDAALPESVASAVVALLDQLPSRRRLAPLLDAASRPGEPLVRARACLMLRAHVRRVDAPRRSPEVAQALRIAVAEREHPLIVLAAAAALADRPDADDTASIGVIAGELGRNRDAVARQALMVALLRHGPPAQRALIDHMHRPVDPGDPTATFAPRVMAVLAPERVALHAELATPLTALFKTHATDIPRLRWACGLLRRIAGADLRPAQQLVWNELSYDNLVDKLDLAQRLGMTPVEIAPTLRHLLYHLYEPEIAAAWEALGGIPQALVARIEHDLELAALQGAAEPSDQARQAMLALSRLGAPGLEAALRRLDDPKTQTLTCRLFEEVLFQPAQGKQLADELGKGSAARRLAVECALARIDVPEAASARGRLMARLRAKGVDENVMRVLARTFPDNVPVARRIVALCRESPRLHAQTFLRLMDARAIVDVFRSMLRSDKTDELHCAIRGLGRAGEVDQLTRFLRSEDHRCYRAALEAIVEAEGANGLAGRLGLSGRARERVVMRLFEDPATYAALTEANRDRLRSLGRAYARRTSTPSEVRQQSVLFLIQRGPVDKADILLFIKAYLGLVKDLRLSRSSASLITPHGDAASGHLGLISAAYRKKDEESRLRAVELWGALGRVDKLERALRDASDRVRERARECRDRARR